jgi:hypothetical protein
VTDAADRLAEYRSIHPLPTRDQLAEPERLDVPTPQRCTPGYLPDLGALALEGRSW